MAWWLSGCTSLDAPTDDCLDFGICTEGGAATPDPRWECLADPSLVQTPPDGQMSPGILYIVPIVDFQNAPAPPSNMAIRACQSADISCDNGRPPPVQAPDPAILERFPAAVRPAVVQLTLPTGFDGYLEIKAPNYVDTLYYFGGPMLGALDGTPVVVGEAIPVPTDPYVTDIFASLRVMRDQTAGLMALRTLDCTGARTANVTLNLLNTSGAGWTLISDVPASPEVEGIDFIPTDLRGVAGFANVTPGAAVVEGISPGNVPYGQGNFSVRANSLTIGEIRFGRLLYGR